MPISLLRTCIWITAFFTMLAVEGETLRKISIDPQHVQKDLSHSYLGANAQQFRSHYSIKQMLEHEDMFSKFLLSIGSPVLRMDGRSVYGWFSKEECLKLREADTKMKRLSQSKELKAEIGEKYQPEDYDALVKKFKLKFGPVKISNHHPDISWFSPEKFHNFCRENNIRIIGAISDYQYYDAESGKVICFRDRPEHFDGAVKAAMKKIAWVKDHGYQDLYVAWEIGNESYGTWGPLLYAAYAKKIVDAAVKFQPDIKLSIPTIVRDTDDPFIRSFIKKLKAKGVKANWFDWHLKMIPALGDTIKKITHVTAHVYGSRSKYNANAKGLALATSLSLPNTAHLRYLVTEWRYTGVGGTEHRTFSTGALWNAKFAMLLLSHPKVDYSTVHEFLCTSGLGYWTPGKGNADPGMVGNEWIYQYQDNKKPGKTTQLRSKDGKPRFDIGPFGPVNRMLNELIKDCPLLLEHKADLGPMSSALYADGLRVKKPPKKTGDLDWIISTDKDRSKIGGVVVNTQKFPVSVVFVFGKKHYVIQTAEQMTCDPDKLSKPEIPGENKFWHVANIPVTNGTLILPPNSITSFRGIAK